MIRSNIAGAKFKKKNWLVWDCCNSNCVVTIVRFQACVHSLEALWSSFPISINNWSPFGNIYLCFLIFSTNLSWAFKVVDLWLLNFILIDLPFFSEQKKECMSRYHISSNSINNELPFLRFLSNSTDRVSAFAMSVIWLTSPSASINSNSGKGTVTDGNQNN